MWLKMGVGREFANGLLSVALTMPRQPMIMKAGNLKIYLFYLDWFLQCFSMHFN